MAKSIPLATFGLGLAIGVAVTSYFVDGDSPGKPQSLGQRPNVKIAERSESTVVLDEKLKAASNGRNIENVERLIEQAAAFDPAGKMEKALNIQDPEMRREALVSLIKDWIQKDQSAALEAIASIENLILRRQLHREAAAALANQFPARAAALLEEARWASDASARAAWKDAFANWAMQDIDAATDKMLSLNLNSDAGRAALTAIASQLSKADAQSALTWADSLPGKVRSEALIELLRDAARHSPMVAARNIEKIDNEAARAEIAGRAAAAWAESDVSAALEWAKKLAGNVRDGAITAIAQKVFDTDPGEALAIAQEIPTAKGRSEVIERIARLQIVADPTEGVKWIESLRADDRTYAWRAAARQWAEVDALTAATFASEVEDPLVQKQMVEALSTYWGQASPSEAAMWAAGSLSGDAQKEALTRVLDYWAREDGEAAAKFAASVELSERSGLTRQVINSWSRQDPASAATWTAGNFEPGDEKTSVVADIASQWLRKDSVAASQWIAALPVSDERDSAVTALIRTIEHDDPAAAAEWAGTITNPKLRESIQESILKNLERGE